MWFFKKKEKTVDEIAKDISEECSAWNEMVERCKKHEGFSSKPYKCPAGKLTIGYGRNIEDNGITKDEAEYLLLNDIESARDELLKNYPWASKISYHRRFVLTEMVFNMGIVKFKQFKNMLAACEQGDWNKAAEQALDSAWHKQVGKRAETLAQVLKEG